MGRTVPGIFKRIMRTARKVAGFETRLLSQDSYERYREKQIAGNRNKIEKVWAREDNIAVICACAEKRLGTVRSVLCHGVRNGRELEWFRAHLLGGPEVLGTDISDTASSFPSTVQWDFHDENPEWIGRWDLVYTNSWDHAFDPERAFGVWLRSLSPRGVLVLEHGRSHEPDRVSELDPFGASLKGLVEFVNRVGAPDFHVIETLELPSDTGRAKRHAVVAGRIWSA